MIEILAVTALVLGTAFIALSALENMLAVLVSERNPEVGRRFDSNSRWLFPILYVTVVAAVAALSANKIKAII